METPIMVKNAGLLLTTLCVLWIPSMASETHHLPKYNSESMQKRYNRWLAKHGRRYKTRDEYLLRFGIYMSNVQFIDNFNSRNLSYKLTDNKFADLGNDEFRSIYLGYNHDTRQYPSSNSSARFEVPTAVDWREGVDWREEGAVTAVKDQGQCGSCWAFSAVAAIEGINKIKTGKLVSLSEQELVDCDVDKDNQGCSGGYMEKAFSFVTENGGITSENDYPYNGQDNPCEQAKIKDYAVTINGYGKIPPNSEEFLQLILSLQPVSVAIDASGYEFQLYSEGIFSGFCGVTLNHGVTAIGYGGRGDDQYWIVKNSWGEDWGENGYIRMARNTGDEKGICGILMEASYPMKN